MNEVAISEAQSRLAEVIEQCSLSSEPISVMLEGQRVAVILDSNVFDRLIDSIEETEDRRELEAARLDNDYLPWDEAKSTLDL